jgi:peptide chain release factor subunit 1
LLDRAPEERLMPVASVSAATIERLSRIESAGESVLSVYLDLDPARFPTPGARDVELSALLGRAGAGGVDAKRVREALNVDPELARGAHSIAIFSCAAAGILEVVALPEPVEPLAVVDSAPWLEPLAAMVTTEDWGVAVVSRRAARLFRGGPQGLVEFAVVRDDLHRRHAQGGWSQARFQRGIEGQVAVHVRHVAERLLRAHQRRPFEQLIFVASSELWPVVEASLHRDLRDRVAGVIERDLGDAATEQIMQAISPVIDRTEAARERVLIDRVEQGLRTGGAAAAGLDEVLAMLEQNRVEVLLVPDGADLTAGRCPHCARLFASAEGQCPDDGAPLIVVDAIEHIVELAGQRSLEVVVVSHEPDALCAHGPVAALLHW